ncbi:MAG: 2Fe-2S iron-sulfur cluster-binding protein, partial [Candidatus Methanomethylicaceae archaeon]
MKEITVTIDGKQVKGKEGETILDICRANGIYVPTLCSLEGLSNTGACRMCLVEIEGIPEPQTACSMLAADGMKIHTNTQKVKEIRKMILELIIAERAHFCPHCPASGDCELQKLCYEYGISNIRFTYLFNRLPIDTSHPYLIIDHNHCVLCGRCIRTCQEIVGNCTLGFKERGWETTICADLDTPLGNSSCISCGACAQACPTGTILVKYELFLGKEEECDSKQSICPLCGQGCEINALVRANNLVRIKGLGLTSKEGGQLCARGRFGLFAETRSRILVPLIRNSQGKLEESSWENALDIIAQRLSSIKSRGGSIVGLISSQSTCEEIDLFRDFMNEAVGSSLIDTFDGNVYRTISYAIASFKKEFPRIKIDGKTEDILQADCVVLVGADPTHTHPIVASFVRRAVLRGGKLIMINSKNNTMAQWTNLYLRTRPSTEWILMNGLLTLVSQKTEMEPSNSKKIFGGFCELSPESVCHSTGVSIDDLERSVELIAELPKVVFVCDPSQVDSKTIISLLGLALLKSNSPDSLDVIFLPPRGNSFAAWNLKGLKHVDLEMMKQFKIKGAIVVNGDDDIDEETIKLLKETDFVAAHSSY